MIFDMNAPEWARLAERRINALFNDVREPKAPTRLFSVANTAALPDAAKYIYCQAYKIDTKTIVTSDGTTWS